VVGVTDLLRRRLAGGLRHLLAGDDLPEHVRRPPAPGQAFLPPAAVSRRVHADASMLVGGIRALLLQSLHPLAMAGVAEHSAFRTDPLGRLRTTSTYLGTVTFGSTTAAEAALAQVRQVHRHVRGTAPDGRPYAADDPALLSWVHHAMVDSFLATHQRYGLRPLGPSDADRYVAEQAVLAERLGATDIARTTAELAAWLRAVRPQLHRGRQATEAVRFLLNPPLPLVAKPAYGLLAAAAVGTLEPWSRAALGVPLLPGVDALAIRPAAAVVVRTFGWAMRAPLDEPRSTPAAA
jgi:uncharacterized protein (DUF2236 family)